MNGAGAFVWKQEGRFDEAAVASAIEEHLTSVRMPRIKLVRSSIGPGSRMNRTLLIDHLGEQLLLRKLRGHIVNVSFWTSWSTASLRELQRLQRLQDPSGERAPIIIAVNSGEPVDVIAEVRKKFRLTFSLVPDPKGLIARQFGVQCWPTTISIGADGIVEHIQLGPRRSAER
jgi:peroxiredoxin